MTTHLHSTTDAREWARVWAETIKDHPNVPYDDASMIGWFANAIMAGYDAAQQGAQPDAGSECECDQPSYPLGNCTKCGKPARVS